MAISDKTRKLLWARSGNRCAICKEELLRESEAKEERHNVGEECHIISAKVKGPRHVGGLPDYNNYDNLLLLCRNHHKEIDTLTETYPEELLRYMKTNHENWVSETLDAQLRGLNKETPRFIKRIMSGKELVEIIGHAHGYRVDYDEQEDTGENEFIGSILQAFTDYGDLIEMISSEPADRVRISIELKSLLVEMEGRGYILFADKNTERVKYGEKLDKWSIATLIVKKMDSEEILNF